MAADSDVTNDDSDGASTNIPSSLFDEHSINITSDTTDTLPPFRISIYIPPPFPLHKQCSNLDVLIILNVVPLLNTADIPPPSPLTDTYLIVHESITPLPLSPLPPLI